MYANSCGGAETGAAEHGRPEQGVKIDNVLADKVIQLAFGLFAPEAIEVDAFAFTEIPETGHVTDRCIQPDIEVFARRIRDFKAEIRRIATDVPLVQATFQPFTELVGNLFLHVTGAGPGLEKVAEFRQLEKKVRGSFLYGRRTRDDRHRIDQVRWRIGGSAGFAVIAVLVVSFAFGAGALDIPIRQKQMFFRIVGLGDFPCGNMAIVPQAGIDQ